jgi:hypothetical protein
MAPALLQAATLALRAAGACPAQPTCPQDDKCNFLTNGQSFEINCATDFAGGDLKTIQASTLAECIDSCGGTNTCVAISYVGQNCYLKDVLEAGVPNNDVTGAYLPSRVSSSSVLSAVGTSTTAVSSLAVVTSVITVTPSAAAFSPASTSTPGALCPATYTCPENDGCRRIGADGRTFVLTCGHDVYGSDYSSAGADNLDDCTEACAAAPQCVAASYVGGKSAGQCYLKAKNNGASENSNVDSFYYDANAVLPSASASAVVSPTSTPAAGPSSTPVVAPSRTPAAASSSTPSNTPAAASSNTPAPSASRAASSSAPVPVPTIAPVPAQVVANSGFESGSGNTPSGWTYTGGNAAGRVPKNPFKGAYSFQTSGSIFGSTATLRQDLKVVPGKAYTVQLFAAQGVSAPCVIDVKFGRNTLFMTLPIPTPLYMSSIGTITSAMTSSGAGGLAITVTCPWASPLTTLSIDEVTVTAL